MSENKLSQSDRRRTLPSVNALLELVEIQRLLERAPRGVVVSAVRAAIEDARSSNGGVETRDQSGWAGAVEEQLARLVRPSLRPLINGTGVVLHTNLGRAPLAEAAIEAMIGVARGYSNLEYDVEAGARGSRYAHCVGLLVELTGAEDALVVNNGAAALVLALNTLARDRGAVISRGELVEIGGSFRIPEIMERSGARLVEVGTTNRTHLDDYRKALGSGDIGAVVKVHRSNFAIEGFVAEARVGELASIAAPAGIPIIHDLGSGLLIALDEIGSTGEPTARDALAEGATILTMSGDKLLGGPQAGIIVGERSVIAALRRNPLTRAFRVDKLTLAALEATLALYRDPSRARREIPVLAMLACSSDALHRRAETIQSAVRRGGADVEIVASDASVGGGAFPTARIPSVALAFSENARELERRLRFGDPAVIGRLAGEQLLLDLRTVQPREDDALTWRLLRALDLHA